MSSYYLGIYFKRSFIAKNLAPVLLRYIFKGKPPSEG